jgi:hypothetical protein
LTKKATARMSCGFYFYIALHVYAIVPTFTVIYTS